LSSNGTDIVIIFENTIKTALHLNGCKKQSIMIFIFY